MAGFLLGRRGRTPAQPSRPGPELHPSRPPSHHGALSHHRALQHPAVRARAHAVTCGLTDYDEFNPTSWILGPYVHTHAPSRHMTNIGQAGSRHPSPRVGQARIRPHHGHQPRESHLRFHPSRPKRASKPREGIHHSPSPPSPTSADSEHPSRRETWSANICSPGNGPSRGGERRWTLHPTNMTATGSSTPAPYGRHWLLHNDISIPGGSPRQRHHPTPRPALVSTMLLYTHSSNGTYRSAEQ